MSRGMPSMVALLGLLAVAGYQNRDKIAEMLGKQGQAGGAGAGGTLGQQNPQASQGGVHNMVTRQIRMHLLHTASFMRLSSNAASH